MYVRTGSIDQSQVLQIVFVVALKRAVMCWGGAFLSTLAADTPGKLDVLGHNGDTLGVDGAQVGVLEKADEVSLASLLQSHNCRRLEAEIGLEVLSNLSHQTLEGKLADEQLS